ncbi:MAG: helix-turn-helix domain-containing protein [Sandaracinaceae bacterium]|nr:helix-turn-helix domain-containing protein [Sandaracinaceae bacterium]
MAAGVGTTETARALGTCDRSVRKWRARWEQAPVVESLRDGDRPGRPRVIVAETRCTVLQLACDKPDKLLHSLPRHLDTGRAIDGSHVAHGGRNQP